MFTYDNVLKKEKVEEYKASYLFAYIDGGARSSYLSKFMVRWYFTKK